MKRLILLFVVAASIIMAFAVPPKEKFFTPRLKFGKAIYLVIYEYNYEDNDVNPGKPVVRADNMALLIGPEYSQYQRYEGMIEDSVADKNTDKYFSFPEAIAITKKYNLKPNDYYLLRDHLHGDTLLVKNKITTATPKDYYVYNSVYKAPSPQTEWTISDEKKLIGEIEVTKATGRLHGRDWTVWFAESIPYPEGPWELCGLPGLILEAYDSEGEHEFTLMQAMPTDREIMQKNEKYDLTTRDAFRKYRKDHFEADYFRWKNGEIASPPFLNFIDKE